MYSAAAYAFAQAFRANNVESAKSRLNLCAKDIREQLGRLGNTSELCSQLGAVLGMLGYCCRATGDASSAVSHFKESVNFLSKVSSDDLESPWWFVMVIILLNEKTTKASSVKPPKAEECDEGEDDDGDLKGVL
ncbi:hypothetical protein POM88_000475 [Heracleum sosnowskyi]|uniref:Uncharacterized protein n=1 Tax=Heracleum sosnowskyi TaxID=360622 RepID=A0AAD8JEE0_9APIA|nr:hypothetical protein POM88_000475 [Heracleum sosnowskyi]